MKIKKILIFVLAIIFVGAISLRVNTLQATETTDVAYEDPASEVIEVIELTPTEEIIENFPQEEPNENEDVVQDIPIKEETEESSSQEELNENEIIDVEGTSEEKPEIEEEIETEDASEIEEEIEIEDECPYRVEIIANVPVGAIVHEGDIIILTAVLYGFDGLEVSYQWHILEGDWIPIEGATAQSYSFAANEENISCWYNVCVTILE